jgi:hypothetical protein
VGNHFNIDHHKPTFHPLGDFLNPALVLLGQALKKSPIGQKLDFANHSYLCNSFIGFVANHFHFGKGVSFDRIGNNNPLV